MVNLKFGSAPTNNVVINHPSVSPIHLEIIQDDQGNFLLTDLNSWHGTFVNGYKIQGMVQLRPTDTVKAGELILPWINYFQFKQAAPATPVSFMPPSAENLQHGTTSSTPYTDALNTPKKPVNKKKLFGIIGGSVLVLVLAIVGIIYLYTRPSYAHLKLIPSNSFLVASVNFKSIAGKVDLEKLQKMEFFMDMKDQARENSEAMTKAFADPMASGVDIFSQPYGFMSLSGGDESKFTGGITFAIKNETDFTRFVRSISRDRDILRSGNFNMIKLDHNSCVAWNDDAGIFLETDRSSTGMENYCRSLFDQKEAESILSVESFPTFQKAQYDIGFFLNYDAIRSMPNFIMPAYLRGATSMATINFNDGLLSYSNEYLQSNTGRGVLGKKGISDVLKNSIPGTSYGVASTQLDLQAIYDFMIKDPNMTEVLDDMAREFRVERSSLPGIFSGDFYFALVDIKKTTYERMHYDYDYEYDGGYKFTTSIDTTVSPTFIFGCTVMDENTFGGMIERMHGADTSNGMKFWRNYRMANNYLTHHNKNYFVCNDFDVANQLTQSGKTNSPVTGNMNTLISSSPVYTYFNLDIAKYPKILPEYLEDQMGKRDYRDFDTFMSMFDYAQLTGDGVKQVLDVHFKDKGNCLNTFLKTGNEIYLNHNCH